MSVPNKIRSNDTLCIPGSISVVKIKPTAETPYKSNLKDIGYDISIVERADNRSEDVYGDVNIFNTGLILNAPKHYHLECIEHPNLHKTGYMMVGGPRIINPDNTEELVIPLYKYKEAEDIDLPFPAAVIVIRESEYCTLAMETIKKPSYEREEIYQSRTVPTKSYQTHRSVPVHSARANKPIGKPGNHMF